MSMSYADAVAAVTAPGERFETGTVDIAGVPTTVFVNASAQPARRVRHRPGPGRRHVPRLRGRALELRRGHGPRSTPSARCSSSTYGVRQGRPGRHRHAQLPRVGRRLRRHHVDRRRRRCRSTPGGPRTSSTSASRTAAPSVLIADHERVERTPDAAAALGIARASACGSATARRRARRRRPLGGRASSLGAAAARGRHRPRRRRHDPLHVGHDRAGRRARCRRTGR